MQKMKVCCISKNYSHVLIAVNILICSVLNDFYNKNGYKYKKYKQAIDYIRTYGYDAFLEVADKWKNAYGKYE